MKGLRTLAKATQKIIFKDESTWVPLYYSIKEDKVYNEPSEGRYFMANLINPQGEKDIEEAVRYGVSM